MADRNPARRPSGDAPENGEPVPATIVVQSRSPHPVWWLIGVSLAAIAVGTFRPAPESRAWAQSAASAGAHGVFAFTGQLTEDAYGVFMVDVDAGTLWCYRYFAGKNQLRLVAARDWRYDRYLENHSTEPAPDVIKGLLDQQRAANMQRNSP